MSTKELIDNLWQQLNHYKNILRNSDCYIYKNYNMENVKQIINELENKINLLTD